MGANRTAARHQMSYRAGRNGLSGKFGVLTTLEKVESRQQTWKAFRMARR